MNDAIALFDQVMKDNFQDWQDAVKRTLELLAPYVAEYVGEKA